MKKVKLMLPIMITVLLSVYIMTIRKNNTFNKDFAKNIQQEHLPKNIIHKNTKPNGEMRAVWVTFMTLDMQNTDMSERSFCEKFDRIVNESKKLNLNTLVVHVRPYGDSLYKSKIFPWSHLLTGTQGLDPGYDPLNYMIKKCHEEGLKFHAWINPLRLQSRKLPSDFAKENLYFQKDSLGDDAILEDENGKYLNPSNEKVREKIISGIKEIVENYEVDGIHFDDYFYPKDNNLIDDHSYIKYKENAEKNGVALCKPDWRKSNIDALVCGTYSAIKNISHDVQFGISPQGNIQNDQLMGADVNSWGSIVGFVDYICPQIYVSFDHPSLPFDSTAKQWKELVKCAEIDLYYGLGVYKAGTDADKGSWMGSDDILKREIEYGRDLGAKGFILYSWDSVVEKEESPEIINVIKTFN